MKRDVACDGKEVNRLNRTVIGSIWPTRLGSTPHCYFKLGQGTTSDQCYLFHSFYVVWKQARQDERHLVIERPPGVNASLKTPDDHPNDCLSVVRHSSHCHHPPTTCRKRPSCRPHAHSTAHASAAKHTRRTRFNKIKLRQTSTRVGETYGRQPSEHSPTGILDATGMDRRQPTISNITLFR